MPRSLGHLITITLIAPGAALLALWRLGRLILRRAPEDPADWEGRIF